jgi:hypothetical protein
LATDRLLRLLADVATRQVRAAGRIQAKRAAGAYRRIGQLRLEVARDPAAAALIDSTLRAVQALWRPMAGYRRAARARLAGEQRPAERKVGDAEIVRALLAAPSVKVAAARLQVDRGTIARRLPGLMRHPVHGAALSGARSLQRSTARRKSIHAQ